MEFTQIYQFASELQAQLVTWLVWAYRQPNGPVLLFVGGFALVILLFGLLSLGFRDGNANERELYRRGYRHNTHSDFW